MNPTVLCIGGLDPSGGAGIAADMKTATVMNVYGMSVLTAVTVQHPGNVSRVAPLPVSIVREQLVCLIETMPLGAIKLGMVANTEVAEMLSQILSSVDCPIVIDPVRVATSGASLNTVDHDVFDALLSNATVITPNDSEITPCMGATPAARWAIDRGVAVLHTGGHNETDPIIDTLWLPNGNHKRWSHPRVDTNHTHGSGCTLSTAVAAGLARGFDLDEACELAVRTTAQIIEASASQDLVPNNGPLLHFKLNE